jgi:hypothetical protein
MPKALSGEMLADPFVPIDRPEHHSFNRRVKAAAPNQRASGATLRGMLPQATAIMEQTAAIIEKQSVQRAAVQRHRRQQGDGAWFLGRGARERPRAATGRSGR